MKYRKILLWILGATLITTLILMIFEINNSNSKKIALNEIQENLLEISSKSIGEDDAVTDGCLDEWEDYNRYIGEKIEEASNNFTEDDTHYLLKDVLGYIEVYYIGEDKKEYLYKKTNISTAYLSQEDISDLKIGIEVVGSRSLNKMLEDFE